MIIHFSSVVHVSGTKNDIPIHLAQVLNDTEFMSVTVSIFSLAVGPQICLTLEYICTFYTKCINIICDSIGTLTFLRSICLFIL